MNAEGDVATKLPIGTIGGKLSHSNGLIGGLSHSVGRTVSRASPHTPRQASRIAPHYPRQASHPSYSSRQIPCSLSHSSSTRQVPRQNASFYNPSQEGLLGTPLSIIYDDYSNGGHGGHGNVSHEVSHHIQTKAVSSHSLDPRQTSAIGGPTNHRSLHKTILADRLRSSGINSTRKSSDLNSSLN